MLYYEKEQLYTILCFIYDSVLLTPELCRLQFYFKHRTSNTRIIDNQTINSNQINIPYGLGISNKHFLTGHYHQSFSITGGEPQDNRSAQEVARQKWVQELGTCCYGESI